LKAKMQKVGENLCFSSKCPRFHDQTIQCGSKRSMIN
jgi:hypothetical protein